MESKYSFDQLPEFVGQILEKIERLETQFQNTLFQQQGYNDKPLNISEAAEYLNLSVPTIYSKISRGELPVMKRGGRLYFFKSQLLEYIAQGKQLTNEEIKATTQTFLKKRRDRHE